MKWTQELENRFAVLGMTEGNGYGTFVQMGSDAAEVFPDSMVGRHVMDAASDPDVGKDFKRHERAHELADQAFGGKVLMDLEVTGNACKIAHRIVDEKLLREFANVMYTRGCASLAIS